MIVTCRCGKRFQAPDSLAGKTVKCPSCAQPLAIPRREEATATSPTAASSSEPISVSCQCGGRFKARAHLAGKTVACPKCGQRISVPRAAADDPLGGSFDSAAWNTGFPAAPAAGASFPGVPPAPTYPAASASWGTPSFATQTPQRPARRKFNSKPWIIAGVIGGVVLLPILACCGGVAMLLRTPSASLQAREPFELNSVAVPQFPERGQPMEFAPGVDLYQITIGNGSGYGSPPGHSTSLLLYLPPGNHEPQSLPCMLITGAGTPLFYGVRWGDITGYTEADMPEHVPYVRAGFAVLVYDMDGPPANEDDPSDEELRQAYTAFRDARAGLVNGRNAFEFLQQRVPEVDPRRVYSAGHSSAGTAALLLAAHEPRLAGCIAYAPVYDIRTNFPGLHMRMLTALLPGFADFAVQASPQTHEARIRCPIFLFHAADDSVVDIAESDAAEQRMRGLGLDCTYVKVATGDHYYSMVEEGVPAGIEWLKKMDQQRPAE